MICPRCGPRDTLDTRNAELKTIYAECQRCQYGWEVSYDPSWKPPDIKVGNYPLTYSRD